MFGMKHSDSDNALATHQASGTSMGTSFTQNPNDIIAFVGAGVSFKGTISYKGTVRIDGQLDGEIHTDGILIIGDQAVISAKIEAGSIICQGRVTGDIVATEKVKLLAPAVFEGSVSTPALSMDEGVIFNGTCRMSSEKTLTSAETSYLETIEETLKVR